jgi:hypothetical protein
VDDDRYQGFFLKPADILPRRYEVLRAYFVDHRPAREIAAQFGLTYATTCSLIRDFRAQCRDGGPPPFSRPLDSDVPPSRSSRRPPPNPRRPRSPIATNSTSPRAAGCGLGSRGSSSSCPCYTRLG